MKNPLTEFKRIVEINGERAYLRDLLMGRFFHAYFIYHEKRNSGSEWAECFGTCKESLLIDVKDGSSYGLFFLKEIYKADLSHNLNLILETKYNCAVHRSTLGSNFGNFNKRVYSIIEPKGLWRKNYILGDLFVVITRLTSKYGKFDSLDVLINKLKNFEWDGYSYYNQSVETFIRNAQSKKRKLQSKDFVYDFEDGYGFYGIKNDAANLVKYSKM